MEHDVWAVFAEEGFEPGAVADVADDEVAVVEQDRVPRGGGVSSVLFGVSASGAGLVASIALWRG